MVRTVDVEVAIRACPAGGLRGESPSAAKVQLMKIDVASSAESDLGSFQHPWEIAAVRGVTIRAFFRHGRVLEKARAALLRMATITEVIGCVGFEKLRGKGAVRIVAARAAHFALA